MFRGVRSDHVADGEVDLAACRGETRHKELWRGGAKTDDQRPDEDGRHAEGTGQADRRQDEPVGADGEQGEPDDEGENGPEGHAVTGSYRQGGPTR
jgi:hypothetical protein